MVGKQLRLLHIQIIESAVVTAEFFDLIFLPRKCLHRAHTGDALLRHGIEPGSLLTDLVINSAKPVFHPHRQKTNDRKHTQRDQRQPRVDPIHACQYKHCMDQRFYRKASHKSEHHPHFVHIVLDSRHQLTGVVPVKKVHRQCLNMAEQIDPHFISDLHAYAIPCKFFYILQHGPRKTDPKHSHQKLHQQLHLASDDDLVNNAPGDLRRNHVQHDRCDHTNHTEQIQIPVAHQIRSQFFHTFSFPSPHFFLTCKNGYSQSLSGCFLLHKIVISCFCVTKSRSPYRLRQMCEITCESSGFFLFALFSKNP